MVPALSILCGGIEEEIIACNSRRKLTRAVRPLWNLLDMGFERAIIFTNKVDADTVTQVICAAKSRWPTISLPLPNRSYRNRILFAPPELTDYLFNDDSSYEAAQETTHTIADGLNEFSKTFPLVRFAYIFADCFGGTCLYSGFVVQDGVETLRVNGERNGHRKLLRDIGFWTWYHFTPFTRGYFEPTSS